MKDRVEPSFLALVLHAHLPFVRHLEREDVLEEGWLVHALAECYLPLLAMIQGWVRDGVPFGLTLSLSPTLVAMLDDSLLRERIVTRLERLGDIAARQERDLGADDSRKPLAAMYRGKFEAALRRYQEIDRDLAGTLRSLACGGELELVPCAATHAFLPNLTGIESALRAQIGVAVESHARRFGARPNGMWLPECGYAPGLDSLLAEAGVRWFVAETHALTSADPPALRGPYAPVFCPSGVAALARDPHCSHAVWSAEAGYPGDPVYREFHRDLGRDHDLRPLLDPGTEDGRGGITGIKYWAITDRAAAQKRVYEPRLALARAHEHAAHFVAERIAQAEAIRIEGADPALVVAPFDAELFGHWWYEGPLFLDHVVRELARHGPAVALTTPTRYLADHPTQQVVAPGASSWGAGGYAAAWLDPLNAWAVREIRDVAEAMGRLADREVPEAPLARRLLAQAGREALLAQASDWSFILRAQTVPSYAEARIRGHIERFRALEGAIVDDSPEPEWLATLEAEDNLFPRLEPRVFASR